MTAIAPTGPQVRIRYLRQAAGLTLAQLAERISEQGVPVTESHISRVETGQARASERLLVAWARALGIHELDVYAAPVSAPTTPEPSGVSDTTDAA